MTSFVLFDNVIKYSAFYLKTICLGQMEALPVLARHMKPTRHLLENIGYEVDIATEIDLSSEFMNYASDLQEKIDNERWGEVTDFYRRFLKDEDRVKTGAYIVGVGKSAGLGVLRALADGREFMAVGSLRDESIQKLCETAKSVYFVIHELTDKEAAYVMNMFQERGQFEILEGVQAVPVGFLHGRTFEAMTILDAKQRYESMHSSSLVTYTNVLVDSFLMTAPQNQGENVNATPYLDLNRSTIVECGPIHVLSITSHGMSDLIHLNTDHICGKSPFLGIDELTTNYLPSCMEEDGFCFFKRNGNPVHGFEIMAKHVLINSCGSLRFHESTFDPLFNISYSMLEGHATSFVGALRWKDGYGSESLLYYHLLRAGYTLGQAVSILNRGLFSNQFENAFDIFCLIGDPESRPFVSRSTNITDELPTEGGVVNVQNGFAYRKLVSSQLVEEFLDQKLLLHIKNKKPFYITAISTTEKDALHVFLYGYEHEETELRVGVERFGTMFHQVSHAYNLIDQSLNATLGLNKLYPNWIKQGGKKNLENRMLNIARLYKSCYTDMNSVDKLTRSCGKFFDEVVQIDRDIAQALYDSVRQTSFRFSEYYQENFLLKAKEEIRECYLCGNPYSPRKLEHILKPSVQRMEMICSKCGGIEDKPDDSICLQIHQAQHFTKNSTNKVFLRVMNQTDRLINGFCLISVRKSSEFNLHPQVPIQQVILQPYEVRDVEFEMIVGTDVPIHQYSMQAAFVSTTQIYLGGRPFWVTEQE